MGKLKQLHIDCVEGYCVQDTPENCYKQYEQMELPLKEVE